MRLFFLRTPMVFFCVLGFIFSGCSPHDDASKRRVQSFFSEDIIPSYFSKNAVSGFPMPVSVEPIPGDEGRLRFTFDRAEVSAADVRRVAEYFVLGLSLPPEALWVNLSPYESDRILPENLEKTVVGETLAVQDYFLKKTAAFSTDPHTDLGRSYWRSVQKIDKTDLSKIRIIALPSSASTDGHRVSVSGAPLTIEADIGTALDPVAESLRRDVEKGEAFAPIRQLVAALVLSGAFSREFPSHPLVSLKGKGIPRGLMSAKPGIKSDVYAQYLSSSLFGSYDTVRGARRYRCGGANVSSALRPSVVEVPVSPEGPASRDVLVKTSEHLSTTENTYVLPENILRGLLFENLYYRGAVMREIELLSSLSAIDAYSPRILVIGAGLGKVVFDIREALPSARVDAINKEHLSLRADAIAGVFSYTGEADKTERFLDFLKSDFYQNVMIADVEEGLSLPSDAYDSVLLASNVAAYLKYPEKVFSEMRRVTKQGGRLWVGDTQHMFTVGHNSIAGMLQRTETRDAVESYESVSPYGGYVKSFSLRKIGDVDPFAALEQVIPPSLIAEAAEFGLPNQYEHSFRLKRRSSSSLADVTKAASEYYGGDSGYVSRALGFEDYYFSGLLTKALDILQRRYREGKMDHQPTMLVLGAGVGMVGFDVSRDYPDVALSFVNKEEIVYPASDVYISYVTAHRALHPEISADDVERYWHSVFYPHTQYADLDREPIPFGEKEFDLILIAHSVLPYIKDQYAVMRKAKERLAKDGMLFVQTLDYIKFDDDGRHAARNRFFSRYEALSGNPTVFNAVNDNFAIMNRFPDHPLPALDFVRARTSDDNAHFRSLGFLDRYDAVYRIPAAHDAERKTGVGGISLSGDSFSGADVVAIADDVSVTVSLL